MATNSNKTKHKSKVHTIIHGMRTSEIVDNDAAALSVLMLVVSIVVVVGDLRSVGVIIVGMGGTTTGAIVGGAAMLCLLS